MTHIFSFDSPKYYKSLLTFGLDSSSKSFISQDIFLAQRTALKLNKWNVIMSKGPLAQLGERLHGMQEVVGSIPIGSTKFRSQVKVSKKKIKEAKTK
jgi:hypothetical protein